MLRRTDEKQQERAHMGQPFKGSQDELEALIREGGFNGDWDTDGNGRVEFRSENGAVLNWWPNSKAKTLNVQGAKDSDAKELQALIDKALASKTASAPGPVRAPSAASPTAPSRRPANPGPTTPPPPSVVAAPNSRVFVVHGHDTVAREQLELILYKLGLKPFVLQNTGGGGLTIIEALEKQIVDNAPKFGIVLMTPDDMGYAASKPTDVQPRARQNVVLEMGMLIARLGRSHVAILKKGHIETPSDIGSILYLPFNNHVKETVALLAQRLEEAGFHIPAASVNDASA